MKKILFILALLSFTGCATTKKYKNYLNDTFIGKDKEILERIAGFPTRKEKEKDAEWWIYFDSRNVNIPVNNYSYYNGNQYTRTTLANQEINCETQFKIVKGKVESFFIKGNGCNSKYERE
jgi:hypothetical protein